MKSTSTQGFTLVELMIVIAIIGVLAASLFPMMSGYMAKSRDTARISHISNLSTALGSYYADVGVYPAPASGCVSTDSSFTAQMTKVPVDPVARTAAILGCAAGTAYGYGTGTNNSTPVYLLGARFENATGGNTGTLSPAAMTLDTNTFAAINGYQKNGVAGASYGYLMAR